MLQHLPNTEVELLWGTWFQSKGTSEAYEWFRPKGEQRYWPKFVWKGYIPPKYSFTTWQAILGRLPTRDRLKFLDINRVCPLCNMEPESTSHIFFKCRKSRVTWGKIKAWLGVSRPLTTIQSAIKWMARENFGSAITKRAKWVALAATVSLIWKARNLLVFHSIVFDPNHLVFEIKRVTCTVLYSLYPEDSVVMALGC
ncbi:uncharacterized protein LOC125220988 [Salvia hispanica]|uniref:uncharacterized protein LOC125220988 n=1 Tax=Salvia hispanica TaxID=49212 RepID=UPI0020091DFF|nr:uncharacterized protein LOC125220988 [Salvia hispanica]